jgi:hypothetical protein
LACNKPADRICGGSRGRRLAFIEELKILLPQVADSAAFTIANHYRH